MRSSSKSSFTCQKANIFCQNKMKTKTAYSSLGLRLPLGLVVSLTIVITRSTGNVLIPDFHVTSLLSGEYSQQNGKTIPTASWMEPKNQKVSWNLSVNDGGETFLSQFNFESKVDPKNKPERIEECLPVSSGMKPIEIINPETEYLTLIPRKVTPGMGIRIQGRMPCAKNRFTINLMSMTDPSNYYADGNNNILQVNPRLSEKQVVRNSRFTGRGWGTEERNSSYFPFATEQFFDVFIAVTPTHFRILVNGQDFADYEHRTEPEMITHLWIREDVEVYRVRYEDLPNAESEDEGLNNLRQVRKPLCVDELSDDTN